MRYVLSILEYPDKKILKDKKWSKEIPEYDIEIDGVKFRGITKEQYEFVSEMYEYMTANYIEFGIREVIKWYDNIYKK